MIIHLFSMNFIYIQSGVVGEEEKHGEDEFGWRRLPRPVMRGGFLSRLGSDQTHTQGPDKESANTLNKPLFLVPISPVDACKYAPEEFLAQIESIFVPDIKKDVERAIATVERNMKRLVNSKMIYGGLHIAHFALVPGRRNYSRSCPPMTSFSSERRRRRPQRTRSSLGRTRRTSEQCQIH